jgi:hypothetical protein
MSAILRGDIHWTRNEVDDYLLQLSTIHVIHIMRTNISQNKKLETAIQHSKLDMVTKNRCPPAPPINAPHPPTIHHSVGNDNGTD